MLIVRPSQIRPRPTSLTVLAGAVIHIPGAAEVVRIASDGLVRANSLVLPEGSEGQELTIFNGDAGPTRGALIIPPGRAVMLRHVQGSWTEVGVSRTL